MRGNHLQRKYLHGFSVSYQEYGDVSQQALDVGQNKIAKMSCSGIRFS
ncbi:hypothetical protein [Pedobacter aquatilis]